MIVKTPAGVGNTNALEGAFVYPNPAKDYLQFYAPNAKCTIKYAIFNLNGALVLNGESIDNSNVSQISLASLSKGIYMLQLNNGENQLLKKFIVE